MSTKQPDNGRGNIKTTTCEPRPEDTMIEEAIRQALEDGVMMRGDLAKAVGITPKHLAGVLSRDFGHRMASRMLHALGYQIKPTSKTQALIRKRNSAADGG